MFRDEPTPVLVRVGQSVGLPFQLKMDGAPALGVTVADLRGSSLRLNFSNGETVSIVLTDDTWVETEQMPPLLAPGDISLVSSTPGNFNIELDPSLGTAGSYVAMVDDAVFIRARRGPFSYSVFPA